MSNYPFPLARQIKGLSGTAHEDLSTWPKTSKALTR